MFRQAIAILEISNKVQISISDTSFYLRLIIC